MLGVRRVAGVLGDRRWGAALLSAGLVLLGGCAMAGGDESATVTNIVDGDTIDVELGGEERRVRLLNIDAPEAGECLAEEATAFLQERIPPGTEVVLEYDEELQDEHGRDLAGVFEDDSLVNAEIAGHGLGVAVLVEPNDKFYDDVLEAQESAEEQGNGLFADDIACTLPAQVRDYGEQVTSLEASVRSGTLEEIDGWADEAVMLAAVGAGIIDLLDGDRSTYPLLAYLGPRWTHRADVEEHSTRLNDISRDISAERRAEEQRIKDREEAERLEREKAEQEAREEAERLEREKAEREAREAEEQREREAAEQREANRRAAERAAEQERSRSSSGSSGGSSGSSGGSSGSSGGSSGSSGGSSGSSGGSSGGSQIGPFKNCAAARAAGAAPVYAGDPGYGPHLDRDRDGIGCE